MNRTGPRSTVYGYNALYSHTRESRKYPNETLSLVMENRIYKLTCILLHNTFPFACKGDFWFHLCRKSSVNIQFSARVIFLCS